MMMTRNQLEELAQFDTPTVCNALEQFGYRKNTEGYMMPGMTLRTNGLKPIVGYAVTAKVSGSFPTSDALKQQNLLGYYATVRAMDAPSIAVIQDLDATPCSSFWGEVQATVHKSLGCIGTITRGGVRDLREVNHLGFTFLSTEICVSHGYTHVDAFNCPVFILGLEIYPGDLLHADEHGVVKIPHEFAPQLADACRASAAAELPLLDPCRKAIADGVKPTLEKITQWRRDMAAERNAK